MIEITSAIAGVRAALDLARVAFAARDDAKVQNALIDVQGRLLDITTASLALAEKNVALQAALTLAQSEKAEVERKILDRSQYALCELRPGAFAYASEAPGHGGDAPQHHLCQPCYDKGVKVILRKNTSQYGWSYWSCAENSEHTIEEDPT